MSSSSASKLENQTGTSAVCLIINQSHLLHSDKDLAER